MNFDSTYETSSFYKNAKVHNVYHRCLCSFFVSLWAESVFFKRASATGPYVYIINLLKQYQVTALKHTYQQLPLAYSKECFALASAVKGLSHTGFFPVLWPDGNAKLMSPNKDEITVHGCHCQGDMVVRMRKVLAIPWRLVHVLQCIYLVLLSLFCLPWLSLLSMMQ